MAGEAFLLNFDLAASLEKRLRDAVDAQRPNGGFTETAPFVGIADAGLGGGAGPIGWAVWPLHAAMLAHKYHGNGRAVSDAYAPSAAFVDFLAAVPAQQIEHGLGDWMGLEPSAIELTGRGFEHAAYIEFANMSSVLGNAAAAATWNAKADAAAIALNARFLNESTGVYAGPGWTGTQAAQSMPLFMGLVPASAVPAVQSALAASVAARDGHLYVGSFGIKWLLLALADGGMADAAWAAASAPDYPGFGYMLDGKANNLTSATSLWGACGG